MAESSHLETSDQALKNAAKDMQDVTLNDLFAQDGARADAFKTKACGITFDYSKAHATCNTFTQLTSLAEARNLKGAIDSLLSGGIVNPTEGRPALHSVLRGTGPNPFMMDGRNIAADVVDQKAKMYALADSLRSGKALAEDGAPYKHVICLGIGGSSLGPDMLLDTLGRAHDSAFDMHVVSNIDGHAFTPVFEACDPKRTLLVVASKTFTTIETMVNAKTVMQWLEAGGVSDATAQMVALSAAPEKAIAFGVAEANVLPFAEWVGGRYSMWSSVGFPAVLAFGPDVFEALLKGAHAMDTHFATAEFSENLPVIAAMLDVWYASYMDAATRALFVYDERLGLLPDYLQQLEMESNGKGVTAQYADPVGHATAPILWGGVGTDAQHAVFQLLHQGTHLTPVEFIAVIKAAHNDTLHHQWLLANCFAQSAALMKGRTLTEAKAQLPDGSPDSLARAKSFTGNRPSTTLLLDELTAESLGALVAFYEHRTFVAGTLWGINVYDQMGVELGKELASGVFAHLSGEGADTRYDASTMALIDQTIKAWNK